MTEALLFGSFGVTLLGIACCHHRALRIALVGLVACTLVRLTLTEFEPLHHLAHEWRTLVNLAGLLTGFAVLASHFEHSRLPERLTEVLPTGKRGAFLLLVLVASLSAVLDNIAAALIGGAAAMTLFRRRVHVGYVAAIVAASNAGGAGSVIGDTTTTMLWIDGASAAWIAKAAVASVVALAFFGVFASRQQDALQPLVPPGDRTSPIDKGHVVVVVLTLAGAIAANVLLEFPAVGVWLAILLGTAIRRPDWKVLPAAVPGTVFLTSLVLTASLLPVDRLPDATPATTLALGVVSAFFDNIPLTKLAIEKGGYDWGLLAYAVGYGGSMLWFGSSAGVAIAGVFPEARSARAWLRGGWHVAVAYVLGAAAYLALLGWHPHALAR